MTFEPTFQARCCRLLAQAAFKLPRSLWADRRGQAFVEYALLASVLAAGFLIAGSAVSKALQNALSTMSQMSQSLERAIAP